MDSGIEKRGRKKRGDVSGSGGESTKQEKHERRVSRGGGAFGRSVFGHKACRVPFAALCWSLRHHAEIAAMQLSNLHPNEHELISNKGMFRIGCLIEFVPEPRA